MSESEGESSIISRSKRRRITKLNSSSEESDSDSHEQSFSKKTPVSKNLKFLSSDEDENTVKGVNVKTPATRSSERLKVKNSREFRLPSREEVLDIVSPGNIPCPRSSERKIRELKPRRLVNNFIRECNSYAADRAGDIYLTDSSLSDFIDDDDDGDGDHRSDASSRASSSKDFSKPKRKSLKRRKKPTFSDSDSDDIKSIRKGNNNSRGNVVETKKNSAKSNKTKLKEKSRKLMTRSQKISKRKKISESDESDVEKSTSDDTDDNVPLSTLKNIKKKRVIPNSSESELEEKHAIQEDDSESEEETSFTKLKDPPSRPRSSRHMKLIQKQQEQHDEKYGELLKRRKKAKLNPNDPTLKDNNQEKKSGIYEKLKNSDDGIENLKDLIEICNESDESDKDFVVSDGDVSEEEIISDQEIEIKFLKFLDDYSQTAADDNNGTLDSPPSGFSVQSQRKGRKFQKNSSSKWRRINTRVESDDSSDSESKVQKDDDHNSQLHWAVNQNDIDLVKKLLQQDPNSIYDVGYRKRSVLHLAALNGNADMVNLLLKMKADCEILDKYEFPPIVYAANGHSECLKVLLRHTDIKEANKELIQTASKMSLLHFAVGESRMGEECSERGKCLELLFAHDKSLCTKMLQHRDTRRRTPLEAAVFACQHQCVAILLKHGANPHHFRTKEGGNLLHYAVECASHLKHTSDDGKDTSLCLRQLVEPLALSLNETDTNGFTPLMYACETGNDECALALIQSGASVMTKDSHGTSPLHLAAMAGSTNCVNLLLRNGHPVDCVDNCGWPPLLYANFKAQEECVLALMNPKPEQLFVLGQLLKKQRNEEEKKKTLTVVKNVLFSLASHDAYYTVFNDFIRVNPVLLDEYNHGLLQHTWRAILDFDNKQKWFRRRLNLLRDDFYGSHINLRVKRDNILGSTMQQIGHLTGSKLRGSMGVIFDNEPGICTGPKREFFACLSKDVVDPKRGLFDMSDDSQFSPTPNAYFLDYIRKEPITVTPDQTKSQNDTNTNEKNEEVLVETCDIECTDSELLATDIWEDSDLVSSTNQQRDCTDSELVTAMETAADSGFCSTAASQDQPPEGTPMQSSTGVASNASETVGADIADVNSGAPVQEESASTSTTTTAVQALPGGQTNDGDSTKQSDKNTWIPCLNAKNIVIPNIALRSKLKQLRLIGRLVGVAICQDMLLSLHLSKHFVKQVLGIPLSHPDELSSFDYQLHQNMVTWVQENSVDNLDLPFGIDAKNPWTNQVVSVNFSEDEDKTVDDTNKHEYIKLVSQYKLQTFIEKEVQEFSTGLNEVIPRELLSFFTADEFSLLMNGISKIDVKDWKENTIYRGITSSDQIIVWFWDIVSRLKEEEKALLLKFSTGSPSVPIGGFANLRGFNGPNRFTITKLLGLNKIPQASTCFNMLKLTDYDSEKQLREKLLIAIRHGSEGFSFS